MKKCQRCGGPLDPDTGRCPNCGRSHRYLKEPAPKKKSRLPLLIGLCAGALVLLLLAAAALLLVQPADDGPTCEGYTAATGESTEPTTETTTAPTTEETTEPTTEPPPVYTHPLTGEVLDEPYSGRIFISTISNVPDALPHVGAVEADIVFESFVNGSIVRCIGLFTDISEVERIGSIRSTRLIFNDITEHYDAILFHAGGSEYVLSDAKKRGIDHFSVDTWVATQAGTSIRDDYRRRYIGYEHSLLALGPQIEPYAAEQGLSIQGDPEKDYLLRFRENGTPQDGEAAGNITFRIRYNQHWKETVLDYDAATNKYVYSQYGKVMADGDTGEQEAYTNILILRADMSMVIDYQTVDFVAGGEGYFACGGKIIPILWGCDGEDQPFWFTTLDGEPLQMGVGNSYIAITDSTEDLRYE